MRSDGSVESAERASRVRAALMALGAAILALNAWLQWGDSDFLRPGSRGAMWVLLIALWTAVLATGGGLGLGGRMRALINDELSLRNRSRAVAAGFYVALAAGIAAYLATWQAEMFAVDAVRLITAAGLSTALLVYAWLEW